MSTPAQPASGNTDQITDSRARSNANLKPWQPGQSGNRSGRPRRSLGEIVVQKMLRARVEEDPQRRRMIELIIWALCKRAVKGDVDAARLLLERGYGRVAPESEFEPITDIRVIIHENVPILRDEPPALEGK